MKNSYSYFKNSECEYYPCHKMKDGNFNCLFCYCPLYALGDRCGGNFSWTKDGVKDCSECLIPHSENGYSYIMSKCEEVLKLANKNNT